MGSLGSRGLSVLLATPGGSTDLGDKRERAGCLELLGIAGGQEGALRARRAQIGRLPRRPRRPDQHTTFAKWARGTGPMNSRV